MKFVHGCIAVLATFLAVTSVSAAEVKVSDSQKAEVTITVDGREKGDYINILVCDADYDQAQMEADPINTIQHQGSVIADGSGVDKYVFTLNLPSDFVSNEFNVYISGEDAPYELYFASFDSVANIAENVSKETNVQEIITKITTFKRELAIDTEAFNNASVSSVGAKLADSFNSAPISFTDKAAGVAELQKRIEKFSVLSCFEDNKKEVLFSADTYKYNEYAPINGIDTDSETAPITGNKLYDELLTDTGKANVISGLFGVAYTDEASLAAQYAKCVITECIKNSIYEGYGFYTDVITEGNAKLAGMNVEKYLELSDKTQVNRNIMSNKTSITAQTLESIINSSVPKVQTGGSTSSGGGGGGSSTKTPPVQIVINTPDTTAPTTTPGKKFSDITMHWASDKIEELVEKNILNGYDDGTFKPDKQVTREEACKILATAFDIKAENSTNEFDDVKHDDWFYQYIAGLSEKGIINGVSDTSFGVGEKMTREAFAVAVYRLLGLNSEGNTDVTFTDKDQISVWATDAISALSQKGIINGYDDGSFKPQNILTRAEIVSIVHTILNTQEATQ